MSGPPCPSDCCTGPNPCAPFIPCGPHVTYCPGTGTNPCAYGGAYGPCTPKCNSCNPCCTLNTPIPEPCCNVCSKTPAGPCRLDPPQMMVCYRIPNKADPCKEEYQCFPAYYKLPDTAKSGECRKPPTPFNPLPPCK